MNTYLEAATAAHLLQSMDTLEYPSCQDNLAKYKLIEDYYDNQGCRVPTAPPPKLIGEAVGYFGYEPRHILDVGSGYSAAGLYLAANGHYVTAMDVNTEAVDWNMARADALGIPRRNFISKVGDVGDLTTDDKYEDIIALMLLHCLEPDEAVKTVGYIQRATAREGINVISVYTENNPEEEISIRGLRCFFKSRQLSRMYSTWNRYRDEEGYAAKYSQRDYGGGRDVLIPHIAEIIARKSVSVHQVSDSPPVAVQRTYMDANRQIKTIEY